MTPILIHSDDVTKAPAPHFGYLADYARLRDYTILSNVFFEGEVTKVEYYIVLPSDEAMAEFNAFIDEIIK